MMCQGILQLLPEFFSETCLVLSTTEISVPEFELPPVDDSDRKYKLF